jgi:hypothetical protein
MIIFTSLEFSGSHGGEYEDWSFLHIDVMMAAVLTSETYETT